ncbi:MAG: two-component sensor histidine kinase, partial [Firmicutes bacterium]|nr:two-component sensor histidine kinase [Bacillota bacterium]
QNQGKGLDALRLSQMARPFMRFRAPGAEGFEREGRGLGLFLLTHTANQEGWGLEFHSAPEEGFLAVLEVHG